MEKKATEVLEDLNIIQGEAEEVEIDSCQCTGDGCNSAPRPVIGWMVAMGMLMFALIMIG